MMFTMPDQRSTTDQLADVATKAEEQGLAGAAAWVRAWDWDAARPSEDDYVQLCRIAVKLKCYDAHDALKNIYTKGQWLTRGQA